MGKPTADRQLIASHRRARYDYEIGDTLEAGIVLTGTEVKSLRDGKATISEAYVQIERGEAWLLNAYIPEYSHGNRFNHEPRRKRKLLLHAHEIDKITAKVREQAYTGVPIELYFKHGHAKLLFGLGKGRKHYDKRQVEKDKMARREMRDGDH